MTAITLQEIFNSKGLEGARKELFSAHENNKISDEEFVNLSVLLGELITGQAVMVCHIDLKSKS